LRQRANHPANPDRALASGVPRVVGRFPREERQDFGTAASRRPPQLRAHHAPARRAGQRKKP